MTKQEIIENARKLPREEQVDLAMELWEILDPVDVEAPLTQEQIAELERRMAEADANPQASEEWECLKGRLLKGDF